MKSALIADANQSQLVIVDIQTKLASVMPSDISSVIKNCATLIQAANLLEVPLTYTEQYPKGLGNTVSELGPYLANKKAVEKTVRQLKTEQSNRSGSSAASEREEQTQRRTIARQGNIFKRN